MNEHVAIRVRADIGYDTDFHDWTIRQAAALRAGRLEAVDLENIAEEIESLGKRDRRGIESQLARLIVHLLKLTFAHDREPRGKWVESAIDARRQIELALEDSPSLRARVPEFFERQWQPASRAAFAELLAYGDGEGARGVGAVAAGPAFSATQALDPDFFPGA